MAETNENIEPSSRSREERDEEREEREERLATGGKVGGVASDRVGDARPPASPGSDEGLIDDSDRMPERDAPSQPPTR